MGHKNTQTVFAITQKRGKSGKSTTKKTYALFDINHGSDCCSSSSPTLYTLSKKVCIETYIDIYSLKSDVIQPTDNTIQILSVGYDIEIYKILFFCVSWAVCFCFCYTDAGLLAAFSITWKRKHRSSIFWKNILIFSALLDCVGSIVGWSG
jgi:hypothetical protein